MTSSPTFTAVIYVGGFPGEPEAICRRYCDEIGLCVTVTPTTYVYTGGDEPGVAIGLINYPRFPSTPDAIRAKALRLAELLLVGLKQRGLSVVFPDETIWLQSEVSAANAPTAPPESLSESRTAAQGEEK